MFTGRVVLLSWVTGLVLVMAALQLTAAPQAPVITEERSLAAVKRVCVEKFSGDEAIVSAARELAIAGLFGAKRFIVTEKCSTADAILKGGSRSECGERLRRRISAWREGVLP